MKETIRLKELQEKNKRLELDGEKNTFKVALGVNFEKDENGRFQEQQFKGLKETIKEVKSNYSIR